MGDPFLQGEGLLFFEPAAAAKSLKNRWTRMASTYGSIQVSLSRDCLSIRPRWPIKWLTSILQLDLDHTISTSQIKAVENMGERMGRGKILITFVTVEGTEREVLLYLKKHGEFLARMGELTGRPTR
ncbi:MAG: hypothetical protein JRH07_17950 [Deltaproteobacteria bacterium]|nr:hypothetical protein [Deltaproteobacteria bacterium]MBW2123706.1 hypothetical protein [Deltaproteobacteria bacterium]